MQYGIEFRALAAVIPNIDFNLKLQYFCWVFRVIRISYKISKEFFCVYCKNKNEPKTDFIDLLSQTWGIF